MQSTPPINSSIQVVDLPAGVRERLMFIDFRCLFLGELRRTELMARFGVGTAAATRDIAFYRKNMGGKIELETSTKLYRPSRDFEPVFQHDADRALTALCHGFGESQTRTRALVPCETPPDLCN